MKPYPFTKLFSSLFSPAYALKSHQNSNGSQCLKITSGVSTIKYQTGDFIIEALIGLVLMAIIAVGVTTITSKVEKGKREMSVQELAVSQLRELLVKHGNGAINLCDSIDETVTLPDETLTVNTNGTCAKASTLVNGVTLSELNQPIVLSVTSAAYNASYSVGGAVAAQR